MCQKIPNYYFGPRDHKGSCKNVIIIIIIKLENFDLIKSPRRQKMFWMPAGPNGPNPYPTSPPSETGSEQVGLKTFYDFVNPDAVG